MIDVVGNEARAAANALDPMGWQVRKEGRDTVGGRQSRTDDDHGNSGIKIDTERANLIYVL